MRISGIKNDTKKMSTSFANKMSNCAKSVWLDITWAFKTIVHNSYEWWWKCCQRNTSNQQKSLTIYKFSFLPWNGRCWPEIKLHSARLAKWKIFIFHVDCVFLFIKRLRAYKIGRSIDKGPRNTNATLCFAIYYSQYDEEKSIESHFLTWIEFTGFFGWSISVLMWITVRLCY